MVWVARSDASFVELNETFAAMAEQHNRLLAISFGCYRVKGISLSNFSEEEVRNIQKGGNRACNDLYLAKYDPSRYSSHALRQQQLARLSIMNFFNTCTSLK